MACAVEHSNAKELAAAVLACERVGSAVSITACQGRAVPIHCNHCDDAPCVIVCPTGAISRRSPDDPVLVDKDRCIGCRMCVQACPFGVIVMNPSGRGAAKCDLCVARQRQGRDPACAEACPTGALVFGREDAALRNKRHEAAERILAGSRKQTGTSGQ